MSYVQVEVKELILKEATFNLEEQSKKIFLKFEELGQAKENVIFKWPTRVEDASHKSVQYLKKMKVEKDKNSLRGRRFKVHYLPKTTPIELRHLRLIEEEPVEIQILFATKYELDCIKINELNQEEHGDKKPVDDDLDEEEREFQRKLKEKDPSIVIDDNESNSKQTRIERWKEVDVSLAEGIESIDIKGGERARLWLYPDSTSVLRRAYKIQRLYRVI